jgi:hypothetical protein
MMSNGCRDGPNGGRHSSEEFDYAENEVKMEEVPLSVLFYPSTPVPKYLLYKERVIMGLENHPQSDSSSGELTPLVSIVINQHH